MPLSENTIMTEKNNTISRIGILKCHLFQTLNVTKMFQYHIECFNIK